MTLRTADKPFLLCTWQELPCAECDAADAGLFNRVDHGCVVEIEVAAYSLLTTARLRGGQLAKAGAQVIVYNGQGDAVWSP
jgi:hypothetical protein